MTSNRILFYVNLALTPTNTDVARMTVPATNENFSNLLDDIIADPSRLVVSFSANLWSPYLFIYFLYINDCYYVPLLLFQMLCDKINYTLNCTRCRITSPPILKVTAQIGLTEAASDFFVLFESRIDSNGIRDS